MGFTLWGPELRLGEQIYVLRNRVKPGEQICILSNRVVQWGRKSNFQNCCSILVSKVMVCNHAKRPKNKCRNHSSFTWFIFNLQRRKTYTVFYNIIQCTVINMKNFQIQNVLLGVVAFSSKVRTCSTPVLCKDPLPCFLQATSPTPFPDLLLNPAYPHMWYNFEVAEDGFSKSEVFLVQYSYSTPWGTELCCVLRNRNKPWWA